MNGPTHGTAYAKINLALHVRGRRDDGYHDLETMSSRFWIAAIA